MRREGETAPDFQTCGIDGDERRQFRLSSRTKRDNVVMLLFYPFDFSPVCTRELCIMRNAGWYTELDNLDVWGLSADNTYAHRAFADQYDIDYPLLSDDGGEIAATYDARYDWWDGHVDVPKRSVYVVDTEGEIAYSWQTDDAYESPDFWVVQDALESVVGSLDGDVDPPSEPPELSDRRFEERLESVPVEGASGSGRGDGNVAR